jgi:hypothetical protein
MKNNRIVLIIVCATALVSTYYVIRRDISGLKQLNKSSVEKITPSTKTIQLPPTVRTDRKIEEKNLFDVLDPNSISSFIKDIPIGNNHLKNFNYACSALIKNFPDYVLSNLKELQLSLPPERYNFLLESLGAEISRLDFNNGTERYLEKISYENIESSAKASLLKSYGGEIAFLGKEIPQSWLTSQKDPHLNNLILGFLNRVETGANNQAIANLSKFINFETLDYSAQSIVANAIVKSGDTEAVMNTFTKLKSPFNLQNAILKHWINADADDCLNYLKNNSHHPNYDQWVLSLTPKIALLDLNASQAWVETISDSKIKTTAEKLLLSISRGSTSNK